MGFLLAWGPMEAPFLLELLERSRRSGPAPLPEPLVSALGDVLLHWLAAEHAQSPPRLHRETFASHGCMSPEQARGRPIDVRSDVFSAGVLLFELACGRRPFEGITELVAGEISSPLAVSPTLSPPLAAVLARATALEPQARYATAAELRAALELAAAPAGPDAVEAWAAQHRPAAPAAAPDLPKPPPPPRARPLRWLGATALVVGSLALTLFGLRVHEQHEADVAERYAASLRPCEIVSEPPGAALFIDGVAHPQRAPTVVRFEPGREYSIEVRGQAGAASRKVRDQKRLVLRLADGAVTENEVYGATPRPKPQVAPAPAPAPEPEPEAEAARRVVAYDFEKGPVTFALEPEHQVLIPKQNCIDVPPLRTRKFRTFSPGVFAHVTSKKGGVRLTDLEHWSPEPSTVCVFILTDAPTQLELNNFRLLRWEHELAAIEHPMVFVDGSDRVLVRSFTPGKWRVRAKGGGAGQRPVVVVTQQSGGTVEHVVDRELVIENPKTMWFTVPVRESAPNLRFVVSVDKVR